MDKKELREILEQLGYDGVTTIEIDRAVSQVLCLFKAEVDKLTVIDDEELHKIVGAYYQECNKSNPPKIYLAMEIAELVNNTFLQHTKKQLLDLMGEQK